MSYFEILCHIAVVLQIITTLGVKYLVYRKMKDPKPATSLELFDKTFDLAYEIKKLATKRGLEDTEDRIAKKADDIMKDAFENRIKIQKEIRNGIDK